jgi:hypothetical protein
MFEISQLMPLMPNQGPPLPKVLDQYLPDGGFWFFMKTVPTSLTSDQLGAIAYAAANTGKITAAQYQEISSTITSGGQLSLADAAALNKALSAWAAEGNPLIFNGQKILSL